LETTAKADYQGMILVQIILTQLNDKQKLDYQIESDNIINKLLGKPVIEKINFGKEFLRISNQVLKEMLNPAAEAKPEEKKEPSAEDKAKASDLKTKNNYGVFACNFRVAYISPKTCTEKFVSSSIGMFVKRFTSDQNSFDAISEKGIELKVEGLISK
jgi:hypothetical protein